MAAPRSLDTLAKVSAERIHDEWLKTMSAAQPSLAFEVMREVGALQLTCPELIELVGVAPNDEVWKHTLATLDACAPDPVLRVAALLHAVGRATGVESTGIAADVLRRLKFSNDDRERIVCAIRHHRSGYDSSWSDADVRRWIRRVGSEHIDDILALARAHDHGNHDALGALDELERRARACLQAGAALDTRDLAIGGKDLMTELSVPPGPRIGEVLRALVEVVTDDPSANERQRLLDEARKLLSEERA